MMSTGRPGAPEFHGLHRSASERSVKSSASNSSQGSVNFNLDSLDDLKENLAQEALKTKIVDGVQKRAYPNRKLQDYLVTQIGKLAKDEREAKIAELQSQLESSTSLNELDGIVQNALNEIKNAEAALGLQYQENTGRDADEQVIETAIRNFYIQSEKVLQENEAKEIEAETGSSSDSDSISDDGSTESSASSLSVDFQTKGDYQNYLENYLFRNDVLAIEDAPQGEESGDDDTGTPSAVKLPRGTQTLTETTATTELDLQGGSDDDEVIRTTKPNSIRFKDSDFQSPYPLGKSQLQGIRANGGGLLCGFNTVSIFIATSSSEIKEEAYDRLGLDDAERKRLDTITDLRTFEREFTKIIRNHPELNAQLEAHVQDSVLGEVNNAVRHHKMIRPQEYDTLVRLINDDDFGIDEAVAELSYADKAHLKQYLTETFSDDNIETIQAFKNAILLTDGYEDRSEGSRKILPNHFDALTVAAARLNRTDDKLSHDVSEIYSDTRKHLIDNEVDEDNKDNVVTALLVRDVLGAKSVFKYQNKTDAILEEDKFDAIVQYAAHAHNTEVVLKLAIKNSPQLIKLEMLDVDKEKLATNIIENGAEFDYFNQDLQDAVATYKANKSKALEELVRTIKGVDESLGLERDRDASTDSIMAVLLDAKNAYQHYQKTVDGDGLRARSNINRDHLTTIANFLGLKAKQAEASQPPTADELTDEKQLLFRNDRGYHYDPVFSVDRAEAILAN